MDVNTGATTQIATDIGTNVAGGFALAGLLGIGVWMRKLVGLPKRVAKLEQTDVVVMRTLGALTKYTLASNQHHRENDRSPQMVTAEALLTEADQKMDEHLYGALGGEK